jgi:hypothetical protein
MRSLVTSLAGLLILLEDRGKRDERGLSQSAETAILIAGAVTVALILIGLVTTFVRSKMAGI